MNRQYRKWSDEDLIQAYHKYQSIAQICQALGLAVAGGTYQTIKRNLKRLELPWDTIKSQNWHSGQKFGSTLDSKNLEEILVENSGYTYSHHLRKVLISSGLKEDRCENCKLTDWQTQSLTKQLHHKNGIRDDNRLENLQILCPNCHSQTANWGNKQS